MVLPVATMAGNWLRWTGDGSTTDLGWLAHGVGRSAGASGALYGVTTGLTLMVLHRSLPQQC